MNNKRYSAIIAIVVSLLLILMIIAIGAVLLINRMKDSHGEDLYEDTEIVEAQDEDFDADEENDQSDEDASDSEDAEGKTDVTVEEPIEDKKEVTVETDLSDLDYESTTTPVAVSVGDDVVSTPAAPDTASSVNSLADSDTLLDDDTV